MLPKGNLLIGKFIGKKMKKRYFPLGIAKGDAFCNRIIERKQIINNINKGQHTLITSPRRYGKSSLVLNSLDEMQIPYSRIDLFIAVNSKLVENQIIDGVKKLIIKLSSGPEQALSYLKSYLKSLKTKWIIGTNGINLELIPDSNNDPAINITETLLILENFLSKKKTPAAFFIDEFQEIGNLPESTGIEGGIRSVAQETDYLAFIFSGSNRHILSTMFDKKTRPLYMLCDRISIDRISAQEYTTFINKAAKETWGNKLETTVLEKIFTLTERHPYYLNALCSKLWDNCEKKPPNEINVKNNWHEYALQEESKIARELSDLSTVQKKILIAIARGATRDLSGKVQLRDLNVTSAAVVKALKQLEEKDYLSKNSQNGYFIIDPLIKYSINFFFPK